MELAEDHEGVREAQQVGPQIHCAAVIRTPQQTHGTRTSPTLFTTLVFGMRYLRYEAWLTDVQSTP